MKAIAPYDVKNMAGFTPAFLSGFYADTADVGCDVYMNDAIDMAGEETYDYVSNNIPLGGVSLHETESTIKSKCNAVIESVDRTLYPVWFLSYRNRDRVAYATVNGQTGKVSADLPVSIGRYFAGSALLAVPIFILLNMFFTLRPKVTLNVAAVIALITIILYVFELGKIKRRDQKLDDRGSWEESKLSSRRYKAGTDNDNLAKQMADGRNNARINRVSKKEKNKMAPLLKVVVIFAICMVGIPNFMFAFSIFSAVFSVGSSFFVSAACFAIGVIITLGNCKTYKEVSGGKNVPGSVGALVALAVSTLILLMAEEVTEKQAQRLHAYVTERMTHKPCQYILGTQEFMGYEFATAEEVLIPRPETELLVEEACRIAENWKDTPDGRKRRVLDLCCGSGCIGISFSKLRHGRDLVELADISDAAIALTKKNRERLQADCAVIQTDLFMQIEGKYDMIVSNPPYIRTDEIPKLMAEVRDFEPHLALDGKADGLYFYDKIIREAREYLYEDGYILFEIGQDQLDAVRGLLVENGYTDIKGIKDYAGLDRIVTARYLKSCVQ